MDIHIQDPKTAAQVLLDQAYAIMTSDEHKANELIILSRAFEKPAKALPIEYPFVLEPSESPDFILSFGRRRIGLEITAFRAPQLAKAESIAAEQGIGLGHNQFGFESPNLKAAEVKSKLRSLMPQAGLSDWIDIGREADCFKQQITRIIVSKTEKILMKGLVNCSESWLLIEDRMGIGKTQEGPICQAIYDLYNSQSSSCRFGLIVLMCDDYSFLFMP